ncbi:MAG: type II toxin-antitoxin system RelE/ParE family toxin [Arcobacter sp.]|nr:type II toxin-antitoxin system RelE/ParE family toxin [Arcobacter sp.]
MTKYTLEFDKKASKEVLSLDKSTQNFILDELEKFISNFDEDYEKELLKLTKIKALQGEFKGLFRLKLRTYRVIYEKFENKLVILVLRVSHRKDVYR